MKKTYINPETKIVRVEVVHMIALSERLGIGEATNDASGAESRRGGFWDDEYEEE